MVGKEDFDKLNTLVKTIEERVRVIDKNLSNVKNSPIIIGYQSKRFDLNENLDVIKLLGRIKNFESGINTTLDNNTAGYLKTETDPLFSASPASTITATQTIHWDTAYSWGNHAGLYDAAGTGHSEASSHVSSHESTYNHANYNTAYGWGDHAGLYLKLDGTSEMSGSIDLNDNDLIIDADKDSYLHAAGDDQVEIWAQGARVCGAYNDATGNQFLVADGTDLNPSYSFFSDRTAGIFYIPEEPGMADAMVNFVLGGDILAYYDPSAFYFNCDIYSYGFLVINDIYINNSITMSDDKWIGLSAGGTRFVFDSTPIPNEIKLVGGAFNLNGNVFYIDADGDTYLHCAGDDIVELICATASGKFKINLNGGEDFTFTANSFNVPTDSYQTMASGTWIGIGVAAGRILFTDAATDEINLSTCNVKFGAYGLGVIHSSAAGLLTSSAIANTDLGNLGTARTIPKFAATGLADSSMLEDALGIQVATGKNLYISRTVGGLGNGVIFNDGTYGSSNYGIMQGMSSVGGSYIYFGVNRYFDVSTGWNKMNELASAFFMLNDGVFNLYFAAASVTTPDVKMQITNNGYVNIDSVVVRASDSFLQIGNRASSESPGTVSLQTICGNAFTSGMTEQVMFRMWRKTDGATKYGGGADFVLLPYSTTLYPNTQLDIRLKSDAAGTQTANITVMSLFDTGNVKIAGTAFRATTEGTNHLDIFDGTAPVGTLANGTSLYSTSGELRVMDAAGNATLLSPHGKDNEWIFYSKNTVTGKVLKIDMEKMMKHLNKKFNLDFIHEYTEAVNGKN